MVGSGGVGKSALTLQVELFTSVRDPEPRAIKQIQRELVKHSKNPGLFRGSRSQSR